MSSPKAQTASLTTAPASGHPSVSAHPSASTSPGPTPHVHPAHPGHPHSSPRKSASWRLYVLPAAAFLFLVALFGLYSFLRGPKSEPYNGPVWEAQMQRLQVTIVERGSLESQENNDIVCRV